MPKNSKGLLISCHPQNFIGYNNATHHHSSLQIKKERKPRNKVHPFSKENRKRIEFILWAKVMFGARRFWWPFINRTHFPPSFTRKMCVSSYFFDVKSPSNFRGITRIPCGAHFHARASKTSAEDADWPNAILMFMVHRDALFNVFLIYYDKNGKKTWNFRRAFWIGH